MCLSLADVHLITTVMTFPVNATQHSSVEIFTAAYQQAPSLIVPAELSMVIRTLMSSMFGIQHCMRWIVCSGIYTLSWQLYAFQHNLTGY